MNFPENPETIAIAGDWHGNTTAATFVVETFGPDVDVFVHLGDFGYDFDYESYLNPLNDALEKTDSVLLFIDGNHENFDWLLEQPIHEDGTRHLTDRIFHLPRGFSWEWRGVKFAGIGGAYSIDRKFREKNVSWWPQETISYEEEIDLISRNIQADVLFTHDAPLGILGFPKLPGFPWIDELTGHNSHHHRSRLSRIVSSIRPYTLFHGHYHIKYDGVIYYGDDQATWVTGLAHDGSDLGSNVSMIRLTEFGGIEFLTTPESVLPLINNEYPPH